MLTEAMKRAQKKYTQEKTYTLRLRLNLEKDADIIDALEKAAARGWSRAGYIKALVREDINREK